MKKLIILFLMLILPFNVFAATYTDYSEYQYSSSKIDSNDLTDVQEEKWYKYYYLEKELSPDYLETSNDFYTEKSTESIVDDENSYSTTFPENDAENIQETYKTYFQKEQPVRYLILNNFETTSSIVAIRELTITGKDGININYEINCEVCDANVSKINNKNVNDFYIFPENPTIILDLKDYYNPNDISFEISITGDIGIILSMDIIVNKSGQTDDLYYMKENSFKLIQYTTLRDSVKNFDVDMQYEEEDSTDGYYNEIDNAIVTKHETIYQYNKVLYKYYHNEKIYLDDYYTALEDYIKDENDFIIMYKYRTRQLIENNESNLSEQTNVNEEKSKDNVYIEVEKPIYIEKEVPIVNEKIEEVEKEIIKEVPVEVIKYETKSVEKKENLLGKYIVYALCYLLLKRK